MMMSTVEMKVFKIDDWAYVAALTENDAAAFIEMECGRCEDPEDNELCEVNPANLGNLQTLLDEFKASGKPLPAFIALDGHYAD